MVKANNENSSETITEQEKVGTFIALGFTATPVPVCVYGFGWWMDVSTSDLFFTCVATWSLMFILGAWIIKK